MNPALHEAVLDERLAALEKARAWSPRVVSKLESLIRSGEDDDLYAINPMRFAKEKGLAESEAVDLFLHAAKQKLLEMSWHLVCPICGDLVQSFSSLKTLHSHLTCSLCQINEQATLDGFITISFTVSPDVRGIPQHDPERMTPIDYVTRYRISREAVFPDGTRFSDALRGASRFAEYFEPGESKSFELDAVPGVLLNHDFLNQRTVYVNVEEGGVKTPALAFSFTDKGVVPAPGSPVAPGKVKLSFTNQGPGRALIMSALIPAAAASVKVALQPFLQGNQVFTSQTFRDLFRSEVIQSAEGLAVRDLTLLFTDLKGSTEMYERIGDLNAFALVRAHFDRLAKVVAAHSGAIVKTIGDAVMAAFLNPLDATLAATEMLREIDTFNRSLRKKEIILKIGIHKGASIAVTLNERLDYFGQTVNIAARVQGLAGPEEIFLTEEAYTYEGVSEALQGFQVDPRKAELKGVQGAMQVYRVAPRA